MAGNLGNPGNPTDPGTPTSSREGVVVPAGQVVYDSTLDRYFLGDGVTLGGNEILGARYDTADRSITFDKLSQGAIDYIDASGGASDHGALTGLGDDDHPQYLLADGTRSVSGDLNLGGNALTNGTVSGSLLDSGAVTEDKLANQSINFDHFNQADEDELNGAFPVIDRRDQPDIAPNDYQAKAATFTFTNKHPTLGAWGSSLTMRGWMDGYYAWQLLGPASATTAGGKDNLFFRSGVSSSWNAIRKIWDSGNDGAGSGLDADTVDGVEEAALLRADGSREITGTQLTQRLVPSAHNTHDLGENLTRYRNLYASGTVYAPVVRVDYLRPTQGSTVVDLGANSEKFRHLYLSGNITVGGNVDGRDIATDGTKLDGIEAGATNTNDPLADANQTITASRTIDDGDNGYQFFVDLANGTASAAQLLVNPTTPQVTLSANNGTNTFIVQNNGTAVNFICSPTSTVQLNSDPGADGECFISQGASAAPVYSGFPTVRSATAPSNTSMLWYHTTDHELYAYDSSRSKWLSVTTYEAHFGRGGTLTAEHYMRGPGGFDYNTASGVGHPMRYDSTVIAAWGSAPSGGTSGWNHRIMKWDDSAGANGVAASYAPSGTYTRWQKTDFNVDYDTNDLLGLNMFDLGSATGVSNHTAVIAYKRRPS